MTEHSSSRRPLTTAQLEQRARANLTHGARSTMAIAPLIVSMKKSLLARMGLRQRDLSWIAREHLDGYLRARAKCVAIDAWLEAGNPLIREDGTAPSVMTLYFVSLNASMRALEALRASVSAMSSTDRDIASALAALDAEERNGKR